MGGERTVAIGAAPAVQHPGVRVNGMSESGRGCVKKGSGERPFFYACNSLQAASSTAKPDTRSDKMPDKPDEFYLAPGQIADAD